MLLGISKPDTTYTVLTFFHLSANSIRPSRHFPESLLALLGPKWIQVQRACVRGSQVLNTFAFGTSIAICVEVKRNA